MKKITIVFGFVLLLFSCKKKESPPTGNGNNTSVPTSSIAPCNGFLIAESITTWGSGAPQTNRYFSSATLTETASIGAAVNPSYNGTLSINNTILKPEQIGGYVYYLDTTNLLNLASQRNFQLNASTTLPSFTFNNTDTFPTYSVTNGYILNDTLFKTQSFTLSLSNSSGFDEASCVIYDISNASNSTVKIVPYGTTQITFTTNELSVFVSGTTVLCGLSLKKYNTQTFSNKNFRFETTTSNNFYLLVQ